MFVNLKNITRTDIWEKIPQKTEKSKKIDSLKIINQYHNDLSKEKTPTE